MTIATSEELLALAASIAHEVGEMLMNRPATFEISSKSVAIDIATQMDKASEKFIVDSILAKRPDDGIIGEEGASRESRSGITWVIDPVDGTVNYLYGIPGWSISIAAKDSEGALAGIVHAPSIASTWTAMRKGGARFNDAQIFVNDPVELDRALIGTGFAYDVRKRVAQGRVANALLPQIRDLRRMGSAAVDIRNVAMGRYDGYFESGLFEWDRAAAALIATEAGALFSTNEVDIAFCAGPYLYPRLVEAIESAL